MTPSYEKLTNFIMPTLYTTGNQVKVKLFPSRVCEFLLEDAFCSQNLPSPWGDPQTVFTCIKSLFLQ